MKKKSNSFKRLGKRIVRTSATFLDHLFNDDLASEQKMARHQLQLKEAALTHSLVVLQLSTKKIDRFETIVGFVASKNMDGKHVVIKTQSNQNHLRIVALKTIEKVSVLGTKRKSPSVAN